MLVKIDNELAKTMLHDRLVERWTDDLTTVELFDKMYENYVDEGIFEGGEFDVAEIVDNDYINWCEVICKGEENFDEILKAYNENEGNYDISEHRVGYSYIEAVDDEESPTAFLVRR